MEKCVTSFQKLLPYVIIEYARPLIYIWCRISIVEIVTFGPTETQRFSKFKTWHLNSYLVTVEVNGNKNLQKYYTPERQCYIKFAIA